MVEISYSKFLFRKKEIWLYNKESVTEGGYTTYPYYLQYPGGKKIEEESCYLDLSADIDAILNNISKTTRLHINKAQKLNIKYKIEYTPDLDKTTEFISTFKIFAQKKNIPFSQNRIRALQKMNALILSYAFVNEELKTIHAYLHDSTTLILLHTFNLSNNDSTSALANKYLHWKEILSFKEKQFKTLDFGGIDLLKVPGISQFKLSFGTTIIKRDSAIKSNKIMSIINLFR